MKTPYYKAFVAQTPEAILQSVFKKEEAILIAVSLNNGIYIEGIILDVTKESNHQTAICMLTQEEQVSFFYLHNIALITVKQPKKMVVELSKGAISRPITTEEQTLSVLKLKRWLNDEKTQFGSHIKELNVDGVDLQNVNNRLNILDVFKALKITVNEITRDALGQEVWQSIQTITLQQADFLNVEVKTNTLVLSMTIEKALPKTLDAILEQKLLQAL